MAEFASKGVAGSGLGLGIAGTALGVLNGGLGNLLGGIAGGYNGYNCGYVTPCGDNMPINRYEAGQASRISELETEVKLRDANFYTLSEMGKLRDYVDDRFNKVECQLGDQKAFNAGTITQISCIQNQVAQLMGLTRLVIPNGSVCPGWGDVTVTPATAAAGA